MEALRHRRHVTSVNVFILIIFETQTFYLSGNVEYGDYHGGVAPQAARDVGKNLSTPPLISGNNVLKDADRK